MIRRIIHIDQDKCNGCGACAKACHEGAIDMVDGKARLMREHYCDGLGDCLPACPTGAITFEEREAPAYDEAAVKAAQAAKKQAHTGCPGTAIRQLMHKKPAPPAPGGETESQLTNWPVQINTGKLAEILRDNSIRSVTVLRMEVPCCGGLEMAARRAVEQCGKDMPWQVCTVHIDGTVTKN